MDEDGGDGDDDVNDLGLLGGSVLVRHRTIPNCPIPPWATTPGPPERSHLGRSHYKTNSLSDHFEDVCLSDLVGAMLLLVTLGGHTPQMLQTIWIMMRQKGFLLIFPKKSHKQPWATLLKLSVFTEQAVG